MELSSFSGLRKLFGYLFQKLRFYETGGHCNEIVDGDHKAMVAFDALYYAFGSFEQSSGNANPIAFEEFLGDVGEREDFVADGGDEDEIVHLFFRNRRRKFMFRIEIEI